MQILPHSPTALLGSIAILTSTALAAHGEDAAVALRFELECSFTVECFETETCQDTSFDASLLLRGRGDNTETLTLRGTMQTDAETIALAGRLDKGQLGLNGSRTFPVGHILTKDPSGAARYTTHLPDGPMMINYVGTCTDGPSE